MCVCACVCVRSVVCAHVFVVNACSLCSACMYVCAHVCVMSVYICTCVVCVHKDKCIMKFC